MEVRSSPEENKQATITNLTPRAEIKTKLISDTYSWTEDQSDVLVVTNGSERNLRQGIIILGLGECGIQEHHIILYIKNTISYQLQ